MAGTIRTPNAGMLSSEERPRATTIRPARRLTFAEPGHLLQNSERVVAHGHRDTYDRELTALRESVVRMGELVAAAIDQAVGAMARQDRQAAAAVVAADREVDVAQAAITARIVTTIATQSPVAIDLRFLMSLTHATYELERIGDHAAGVARQVIRMGDARYLGSLDQLGEMAAGILHGVLLALVDLDEAEARRVAAQDDEIDRVYHAFFERTLEHMRTEPEWVATGAHLLLAAKDLERIGDRVTNIAEEIVLLATGEVVDLNP